MNRALIIAAILIVLGGSYALYKALTRIPVISQIVPGVQVATVSEKEETDTYVVNAKYPQFGIAPTDEHIRMIVETAVRQFKEAGSPPPESAVTQYDFQSMFDSAYVGSDVVSAKLIVSSYTGGAHSNEVVYGLNYERETGRVLALDDALAMIGLTLEEVSERAIAELTTKLGTDVISPEGADPTPENYQTFVVGPSEITFIFQPYQVAPYAAGIQEVSFARVH